MGLSCLFGHAWEGCVCTRCGRHRDEGHVLDGCTCIRCHETVHDLRACVCSRCGQTFHDYEMVQDGYQLEYSGSGSHVVNYDGTKEYRCKHCGHTIYE